jgi:hypothetical protein
MYRSLTDYNMHNTQDQNFLNITINDRYIYFNFSSCIYVYGNGKVIPLQDRLWPRGWVEV